VVSHYYGMGVNDISCRGPDRIDTRIVKLLSKDSFYELSKMLSALRQMRSSSFMLLVSNKQPLRGVKHLKQLRFNNNDTHP